MRDRQGFAVLAEGRFRRGALTPSKVRQVPKQGQADNDVLCPAPGARAQKGALPTTPRDVYPSFAGNGS